MSTDTFLLIAVDLTVSQPQLDLEHLLYLHSFCNAFQSFLDRLACTLHADHLFVSTVMFPPGKVQVCFCLLSESILSPQDFKPFNYEALSQWQSQLLTAKAVFDDSSESFTCFFHPSHVLFTCRPSYFLI